VRVLSSLPLTILFIAPLLLSVALLAPDLVKLGAFETLFVHPQFWGALELTLFTGLASAALSLALALSIVAAAHRNIAAQAGVFLAVPHVSLAIGLALLIMPSGVMARLIAVLFTGWSAPPSWVTTQDPLGLALTAALVLKETPFLVWAFASLLNRVDLKQQFAGQQAVARSLGHHPRSVFLKVIAPQLLQRSVWPLVAVLAYGITVVDMALVIGPTQPPTLAQLAWTDINDADPTSNARGAAGVLTLCFLILILLLVVGLFIRLGASQIGGFYSRHPTARRGPIAVSGQIWGIWGLFYSLTVILLLVQSVSGLWPFPRLMPEAFTFSHWSRLTSDAAPIAVSLLLALATASTALVAALVWLEGQPQSRDRVMLWLAAFSLCLPALVIGLGQYRLFLMLGISGTAWALFFAHALPVAAYVFLLLQGPYRGYDKRWQAMAAGMGKSPMAFLVQIKWPMLKAPLLSAFAVGFAVSMAQFVPAQLASAGRYSTLPMEAVTLTAGGNRGLTAAYGLVLMILPLLVFVAAGMFGRPRWSNR
jgi:putative thiamine transport system permease protein